MNFVNLFTSFFFKTTNDGLLEDTEENASRVPLLENASMVDLLTESEDYTVDTQNRSEYTPLHSAIERNDSALVRFLLERGATVDMRDHDHTPLHAAVRRDNESIIQLLLASETILVDPSSFNFDESELPRYTRLMLKGKTFPKKLELPELLAKRKDMIDTTISNWLAPLKMSSTVSLTEAEKQAKAAYRPQIPSILRALSPILKWVEVLSDTKKSLPVFDDDGDAEKAEIYRKMLMDFLFVSVDEDETLENEKGHLKTVFAERLSKLPNELLFSIRNINIQTTVVKYLQKHYSKISHNVADYLVAEIMFDSKKVCAEFYKNLFTHHWEEPLEPPLTSSMIKAREKRFETSDLTVRYFVP